MRSTGSDTITGMPFMIGMTGGTTIKGDATTAIINMAGAAMKTEKNRPGSRLSE